MPFSFNFLKVLVKFGADINHRDRGGRTPLHWAVGGQRPQLAALLLSLGADVMTTDNHGHTALHTAILAGSQSCVALLLQHDRQVSDIVISLSSSSSLSLSFSSF